MEYLLSSETPIVVPPLLAERIGKAEATFLQALHFKLNTISTVIHEGVKWFHNSYKDWWHCFKGFFSEIQIRNAAKNLLALGFIRQEKLSKETCFQEYYYTINYDNEKLVEILDEIEKEVIEAKRSYQESKPKTKRSHRRDRCDRIDAIAAIGINNNTPLNSSSENTPPTPQEGEGERMEVREEEEERFVPDFPVEVQSSEEIYSSEEKSIDREKYSAPRRKRDKASAMGLTHPEYQHFCALLERWAAAQDWVKCPAAIAKQEIRQAAEAGTSRRLEEFKAGRPLGELDCEEWQVPVPVCEGVVKLEVHGDAFEYWVRLDQNKQNGRTRTEAAAAVTEQLRCRDKAAAMWAEYKNYLCFKAERVRQQQALGSSGLGEVPGHLLAPRRETTLEEAATASHQLKLAATQIDKALLHSAKTVELLPAAAKGQGRSSQPAGEAEEKPPTLDWLRQKLKECRNLRAKNLLFTMAWGWGFEVEDGQILEPEF